MGKWFSQIYDLALKPLEQTTFKKIRRKLVGNAAGRVLEIGYGTGVNFPYYRNAIQVDAIEPNPLIRDRAVKRFQNQNPHIPIHTYLAEAENLPFADNTFDSAVATLVFCTIPEPIKALQELKRVCKPNAEILLFEHVKVDQVFLGKTQDVLTPFWKKVCDGCHLD